MISKLEVKRDNERLKMCQEFFKWCSAETLLEYINTDWDLRKNIIMARSSHPPYGEHKVDKSDVSHFFKKNKWLSMDYLEKNYDSIFVHLK